MLKQWYQKFITPDWEKSQLVSMVRKFVKPGAKVLDVGCGYGRYYYPLKNLGYNVLGIELNNKIVEDNRHKGMNCLSVEAFKGITTQFDTIILSHIIEHFNPNDLFLFLEHYLSKLKRGGYLVIATPLYSDYFYDDFDHVKPYHPEGLQMVFSGKPSQVQYHSKQSMALCDIWFRKSPFLSTFHRAKFVKSPKTRLLQLYDFMMSLLYRVSAGVIGRKDGWVGVFQKQG